MKPKLYKMIIALSALLLGLSVAQAQKNDKAKEKAQEKALELEQEDLKHNSSIAADPAVVITVCLESGNITINGGDRREVRVSAEDGKRVMLRRADQNSSSPATRLEVLVTDMDNKAPVNFGDCQGTSDLDLEVPRGATLYVTTRDGDIDAEDVAEVRADSSSGTISIEHASREINATSIDGDITVEESSGRMHLRSFNGSIEVVNAKMLEQNDFIEVKTTSGDVRLEDVAQPHVEVSTISGDVSLTGSLARGGFYDFKTVSSDITLTMPDSVTFQVTAKVSQGGEVITDFPLKYTGEMNTGKNSSAAIASGKISGTYGTGSASSTINLVSFSGTLRLHKK